MATTEQISNESFSLNWLGNTKNSSLDFLEESLQRSSDGLDGSSFIDMDSDLFSLRWTNSIDFDFSLPSSGDSSLVLHADQIFFNGHLLPLHLVNTAKNKEDSSSPSLNSSKIFHNKQNLSLYRQSAKSPVKMLRKYLYFLIPLYRKVRSLKKISAKTPRSFDDSTRGPPATGVDRRRANRVFDVAFESSIQDAVLHCKKSISMSA